MNPGGRGCGEIVPRHYSLGYKSETPSQKKQNNEETNHRLKEIFLMSMTEDLYFEYINNFQNTRIRKQPPKIGQDLNRHFTKDI